MFVIVKRFTCFAGKKPIHVWNIAASEWLYFKLIGISFV